MTETRRPATLVNGIRPPCLVNGSSSAGLDALLRALRADAALTPDGWRHARSVVENAYRSRSRVAALRADHPEIDTIAIDRPVFVTGLHRSGTTLLHHLLSRHPDLRAPALWEQLAPASEHDVATLLASARAYVADYATAAPGFPAIHRLYADEPDECHRLMSPTFRSRIFAIRYRVPSYEQWLATQDMTVAYAYHRTSLRCILWRVPAHRLVLKCPFHLADPDALRAVYPDALVIRLHRDPADTIPSACSLTATIRAARSAHVDPAEIGREWVERTATTVRALSPGGWRGHADDRVLDVRYRDLVADPLRVVAGIFEFVGVPARTTATRAIRAYLDASTVARNTGPAHRYAPSDYGLDRADIGRRFATYRAMFSIG